MYASQGFGAITLLLWIDYCLRNNGQRKASGEKERVKVGRHLRVFQDIYMA